MEWGLAGVSVILAVEVFLRVSFRRNVSEMLDFMRRSGKTITSAGISDHWKEKVLAHYALKIFINSLQLLFCLFLIVSPVFALHLLGNLFGADLLSLLMTPLGIILSILFASLYVLFRNKVLHVGL